MNMAQALAINRQRLGEYLISKGVISEDELEVALWEQKRNHRLLGEILLEFGFVKPEIFYPALAEFLGYPYVDLSKVLIPCEVSSLIPVDLGIKLGVVAYHAEGNQVFLAISDPENIFIKQKISQLLYHYGNLHFHLASIRQIQYCYQGKEQKADLQPLQTQVEGVMQTILDEAVLKNASDIHFIPERRLVNVYYRVDGLLQKSQTFHTEIWQKLIVYIKLISRMDIAETRKPQDGRFDTVVSGESIDCRLSVIPTIHAESIAIRLLRKEKKFLNLNKLGFIDEHLHKMRCIVEQPQGLFLIAGPTGAGKTTTLYALLNEIDCHNRNVVTIEDPVEYIIPGIRQSEIQMGGLQIAEALRAFLRHDPDVLYISEIRDLETARLAVQASLTGHLVLATIHANNVFSIPLRLKELGLDLLSLSNSVIGMMSQRLIRKVCDCCKGRGCEICNQTSYHGRIAIAEILKVEGSLKSIMATSYDSGKLSSWAAENGVRVMADYAAQLVAAGITTKEEINRVLGEGDAV